MNEKQILVVEDEVIVCADLKQKLEKMGYVVPGLVRYGEKVLDAVRETSPDMILMDIKLKGDMNGIQAAEQVKEFFDIPIIFLTSYTDQETLDYAKKANPFGYLVKPVRLDELKICIEISLYKASVERKIKDSELRFRTVADFAYDWETWLSPQKTYLHVSPSSERITGYSPEEFINRPTLFLEIVYPEDRERVAKHFLGDQGEEPIDDKLEFRILRKDKTLRWIEHVCQPVYSGEGEYLGRRASNRDITGRKKLEEDRDSLIEDLQEAMSQVKKLSGLLPICSFCKKIRDDKGEWKVLEVYIAEHSEAKFSHGFCAECAQEHYFKYLK